MEVTLWALRRPAAWEVLTAEEKVQVLERCLELLADPRAQYVPTVLAALADDRIAGALPEEGRRRVVQRIIGWARPREIRGPVVCGVLTLLRQPLYWNLDWQVAGERHELLEPFLQSSDADVQATLLGSFVEDHVWNSLPLEFQTRLLHWAQQLSASPDRSVHRNAVWLRARRWGIAQDEVRQLLQSRDPADLIVGARAAADLAGYWGENLLPVMQRLWQLMACGLPHVEAAAWPAYARLLRRHPNVRRHLQPFLHRACEVMRGGATSRAVLYGILDALLELAQELDNRDRRRVQEVLRSYLSAGDSRDKLRRKAQVLHAALFTSTQSRGEP